LRCRMRRATSGEPKMPLENNPYPLTEMSGSQPSHELTGLATARAQSDQTP